MTTTHKRHPLGDLIDQRLQRRPGLTQRRLAEESGLDPGVVSAMCRGKRLTGDLARERVLQLILGLARLGVLTYADEADALLDAAGKSALAEGERLGLDVVVQREVRAYLCPRPKPEIPTPLRGGHLPQPEYLRLIGGAALEQKLRARLCDPDGPRFISLEGLGGIGKTALAHKVAADMLHQGCWQDVLWVSARQEYFNEGVWLAADPTRSLIEIVNRLAEQVAVLRPMPTEDKLRALQPLFTAAPYLVVIDNLETVAELDHLLPQLQLLAGATRFLITSRETLARFPYVYTLKVPELSPTDSAALVTGECERHSLPVADPATVAARLHAVVGGNPLALKLATAQLGHCPLDTILADLERPTHPEQAARLYQHIYRRTWELLMPPARALLLSLLTMDPAGEDFAFIQDQSGLDELTFTAAVKELRAYSLLETYFWKDALRYGLHRLTVTFLHTDVLHQWTH
ncbi:MAG TPA: NB-ARC domain-containing protein [Anaerolineae bacterium]|nr:NB-ARC domain-containing protein [Anaerolineae bacterium]